MSRLSSYLRTAALHYRQQISVELTYRAGLAQVFVAESIALYAVCLFWLQAASTAAADLGYGRAVIIAYFLIVAAQEFILVNRASYYLSQDIRSGKMSAALVRPFPYMATQLTRALAIGSVRVVMISPLLLLALWLLPEISAGPLTDFSQRWHLYLAALAVAILMDITAKFCVGLLAFSMTQTWGPEILFISVYSAGAGILYPIDLLPKPLLVVAQCLPFYYVQGLPALIFSGRLEPGAVWIELMRGCIVLALTAFAAWSMWRRGLTKYEAVGI